MTTSFFKKKEIQPDEAALKQALGKSYTLWQEAFEHTQKVCSPDKVTGEWKFYSKKAGWSYTIKCKKRTLFYLIPMDGFIRNTFVLGKKAVAAAQTSDLPEEIIERILSSTAYMEGRSCYLELRTAKDLNLLKQLLAIKMAH
ncbi:hypothetical protein NRIC_09900 [Enterococcus florum]|uniref:DUF3788 domain-containing protein n=1 Tax=Enterococcus florum TaxID=2480627 RepID=A0A4V0WP97_9ENTE|nr:DUF3788 domain-containing protein [Enterococcus florum]GCF93099.1 hypothetical protein NRIC_09900 [Enterococcus florum]